MTFSDEHIELDQSDQWFLPEFEREVEYDRLVDLYLGFQACLEVLLDEEFFRAEAVLGSDFDIQKLASPLVSTPETTELARKLTVIHGVLINYVDDGYND